MPLSLVPSPQGEGPQQRLKELLQGGCCFFFILKNIYIHLFVFIYLAALGLSSGTQDL